MHCMGFKPMTLRSWDEPSTTRLGDKPNTRCVKCMPMCASARVAPSNIVYL